MAGYRVHNLEKLNRFFALAGPQAKRDLNQKLRLLAEPMRSDAEQFARSGIRRIGTRWPKMRVGVTRKLVYVAPKERGVKVRGATGARPALATLLEQRAMAPAERKNEAAVEKGVEEMFDALVKRWNAS